MAPKREFLPSANRAGAVRHGAAGSSQPRPDLRHRSGGADVLRRRCPNVVGGRAPPHGWHLSPDRVPVPPIPGSGRARVAEIRSAARSCRARRVMQVPTGTCGSRWSTMRGGLYIDEPQPQPQPQAEPQEEDDPDLQAALAASREQRDLDKLAKWPHLAKTLRASALEKARKAQEDA
ncbi:hypothetical protein QYE76_056004 [Lolium multiflorum]|uniref:Uncharacterized protein n=1 Tax=Lolium multiflorum TaxID=4521 RepID=A0AAD8T260_LOLMU|nr:hypothetical protein QYE76_056004 [Lolium multiflorum]